MRRIDTFAVVLAGGEGRRLRQIATNRNGMAIPKQYCSLGRSPCLLQDALTRAGAVAMPSHVCTVVAAQHRQWWTSIAPDLNESNVFVQPQNKGTAFGILLALLTLELRNPQATLALLPADHYFRDEEAVTRALRIACNLAGTNPSSTYLLGADPETADPELGYILPGERAVDKPAPIAGFTEKPNKEFAKELISLGAMWNLFILVGSVNALLQLFVQEHADAVSEMREALQRSAGGHSGSLDRFYEEIEPMDFSKDILELRANLLQVLRVPHCGWTDLGTPKRVEATVRSIAARDGVRRDRADRSVPLFFDLGSQYY
ncbi:MAG TPA: sugar phosphate nucleotidyltransferase [Steroidobacteraceae bacterium]|nr:sugar phosphate nucleotidyltransferase [Steroidobacteraceae bacterium]